MKKFTNHFNQRINSLIFLTVFLFSISRIAIAQSPVPDSAVVELIASGFQLAEGPYWHPDEYLIFSDVSANVLYKWSEDSGIVEYLNPSGNANGVAADLNGNIIICQHSARQVGRIESNSIITPLATNYNGDLLHSPNDLAVKSDGAIFFTDPPWGGNPPHMNFHGVYRIPPGGGDIQLLVDNISYPNGICFSPDESKIYISDSGGKHVFIFDVIDDSTIANKTLFATLNGSQAADGMKVDSLGNLYVTGSIGVAIYAPDGTLLDEVEIPGQTTNANWGGENNKVLFITSFPALYKLDMNDPTTSIKNIKPAKPKGIQLNQNYPNPFNPSTIINYELDTNNNVELVLYDIAGQKVKTLVNSQQNAGEYFVSFNANGLTSGIYFYKLKVGLNEQSRKMILLH